MDSRELRLAAARAVKVQVHHIQDPASQAMPAPAPDAVGIYPHLSLEAEDAYKFQGYVDGDTLYVKSTSKLPSDAGDCRITLYLPRDYRFHEVEVLSTSPLKTCLSLENSTSWSSSGQSMSSYRPSS